MYLFHRNRCYPHGNPIHFCITKVKSIYLRLNKMPWSITFKGNSRTYWNATSRQSCISKFSYLFIIWLVSLKLLNFTVKVIFLIPSDIYLMNFISETRVMTYEEKHIMFGRQQPNTTNRQNYLKNNIKRLHSKHARSLRKLKTLKRTPTTKNTQ